MLGHGGLTGAAKLGANNAIDDMTTLIKKLEASGGSLRRGGSTAMRNAFKMSMNEGLLMTFEELQGAQRTLSTQAGKNARKDIDNNKF